MRVGNACLRDGVHRRHLGTRLLEHGLLDRAQTPHLFPHLHLGVAVGLQYRCGTSGNSAAIPVTNASCWSDSHSATGVPSAAAHSLALASSRRTSHAVADNSGSANHTRFWVNSRTTYNVSCPFSGCSPSIERRIALVAEYCRRKAAGSSCRAANMV